MRIVVGMATVLFLLLAGESGAEPGLIDGPRGVAPVAGPRSSHDIPVDEVEPNDGLDGAQDLGAVVDGWPIVLAGTLANHADEDFFVFTTSEGGCVDFTLDFECGSDFDLYLYMYDPNDGVWYLHAVSLFDCPEVISGWTLEGGLWGLGVAYWAGVAGAYSLTVAWAQDADADGDGYFACSGDCDDADPLVNPGSVEVCDDGFDNDCDGVSDIDDGECGCVEPEFDASCGAVIAGSTIGQENGIGRYGCTEWDESGPEDIYRVYVTDDYLIAEIGELTADLDVFILADDPLGACAQSCVAFGDVFAVYEVPAAGIYHVVVDGYAGEAGPYVLEVNCCHDEDADGFFDEACGGTWGLDCDDGNSAVHPDAHDACGDGIDNDCDGLVDREDDDCPCGGPGFTIACGSTSSGDTTGGNNAFSSYGCRPWDESGPEAIHALTLTAPGMITAELAHDPEFDLDVFILGDEYGLACPSNCLGGGDEVAVSSDPVTGAEVVPAGTYHVVVDGYLGDAGPYALTVRCCLDRDGDGFADGVCGGSDCDDADPTVNPAADEVCGSGLDEDCDGLAGLDFTCVGFTIGKTAEAPVIDGVIDDGEWDDAYSVDISFFDLPVTMYLKTDDTGAFLYGAIDDHVATVLEEGVQSGIFFDKDNDGAWPSAGGEEGNFWLYWSANEAHVSFRGFYTEGETVHMEEPGEPVSGVEGAMAAGAQGVQMEWKIDLAESPLDVSLDRTIGLYVYSHDGTDFTGVWAADSLWDDPSTFVDVELPCVDPPEEGWAAGNCDDGIDNDCDGLADMADEEGCTGCFVSITDANK